MANGSPSLDDILKQIEMDAGLQINSQGGDGNQSPISAGMTEVSAHESRPATPSPSPLQLDAATTGIPQISRQYLGGGAVVSDNVQVPGLSARQKGLPKLSYRMLGSLAAVFVLVIGLGSAVLLTQQPQDVRQYAFDPAARLDPELQQYVAQGSGEEVEVPGETTQRPAVPDTTDTTDTSTTAETYVQAAPDPATTTRPWWQNPLVLAGVSVVVSAGLILAVFLHWLFAV